jgi:hypothetical protein
MHLRRMPDTLCQQQVPGCGPAAYAPGQAASWTSRELRPRKSRISWVVRLAAGFPAIQRTKPLALWPAPGDSERLPVRELNQGWKMAKG